MPPVPQDALHAHAIAPGYFSMLSPLASSDAGSSHATCPATDTPHTGALYWLVLTRVSWLFGFVSKSMPAKNSRSPAITAGKSLLACQGGTWGGTRGGTWDCCAPFGGVPFGGTTSSDISTTRSFIQPQLSRLKPRGPAVANDNFRR